MEGGSAMKCQESQIIRVKTAYVQDNKLLALSVNRQDIERCTKVIRQYGLLTPPVVGNFTDGAQLLLSGECEFMALREMGIKSVEAVTVPISQKNEGDKLSLLLSSLKKSPNALSEGLLINEMLKSGIFTQSQLGEQLGKSVSWVSKRVSLVTRLHPAVCDLVTKRQLCPHSAQEIARLPEEVQHNFSVKIVRDGIPKSAVEALVSAFNAPNCPDEIKQQIANNPKKVVPRLSDIRTAKPIRTRTAGKPIKPCTTLKDSLIALREYMAEFAKYLHSAECVDIAVEINQLKEIRADVDALKLMLDRKLHLFSPGKIEKEATAYGN